MTCLRAKIQELQELERQARHDPVEYREYYKYKAAEGLHAMLDVLAGIQPGDNRLLERAASEFNRYGDDESRRIRDCLRRLQAMCMKLEEEGKGDE